MIKYLFDDLKQVGKKSIILKMRKKKYIFQTITLKLKFLTTAVVLIW